MDVKASQVLPLARTGQLIVQEMPDEVLVYDLDRHKAHCLNKTSALVWKYCDGKRTAAEVVRLLEQEFATPVGEDVVSLALNQLRRFHLLEEDKIALAGMSRVTRRELVRKYLPAALALPVIISIAAPTPAQTASTCAGVGQSCTNVQCCPGLNCDGTCFQPPPP